MSESPYRSSVSEAKSEAMTDRGLVVLHVAPNYTRLTLGPDIWTIADDLITHTAQGRKRIKKKSIVLRTRRLFVAKAWPTNEAGLWIERREGVVQRLFGLPPQAGMTEEVMSAWRDLERLTGKLQEALKHYSDGAKATEIGNGQHRVLALEYPDRMVLYARPIFRERPRREIELHGDGSLVFPPSFRRKVDRILPMKHGVKVIASGDRVCFCHPDGEQVAHVFLPWIGAAERKELTQRFQQTVGEPLRADNANENAARVEFSYPIP